MPTSDLDPLKAAFNRLSPLPEAEWALFAKGLSIKRLSKGQAWIQAGQSGDEIAYVLEGLLRVYYLLPNGAEFIRSFRPEGQFSASYSAALTRSVSEFTIEAIEDTKLVVFSYQHFAQGFTRHLCWQEIGRKISEALYIVFQKREYELLCLSAEDRYRSFREEFRLLTNRLSQAQVASYLGITPVSLSRLLGKKRQRK